MRVTTNSMTRLAYVGFLGLSSINCSKDDGNFSENGKVWDLPELTAEEGFSLWTPAFDMGDSPESQNCYFVDVPDLNGDGSDFFVSRVHAAKNSGSHHLNVFRVKTIVDLDPQDGVPIKIGQYDGSVVEGWDEYRSNPCWQSSNWSDWPLVANSQDSTIDDPYTTWQLPDDVGIRMTPGEKLMVQTHYVNRELTRSPHGVAVGINFHRYPADVTPIEMGSLLSAQYNIRICQSDFRSRASATCRLPSEQFTIDAVNGHFHSRGKQFSVYTWDGESTEQPGESARIYASDDWSHPPMATGINTKIPINGGIWWNCDYEWRPPTDTTCEEINAKDGEGEEDCCYTAGGSVDIGEHCNVFMYYYPRANNEADILCN